MDRAIAAFLSFDSDELLFKTGLFRLESNHKCHSDQKLKT